MMLLLQVHDDDAGADVGKVLLLIMMMMMMMMTMMTMMMMMMMLLLPVLVLVRYVRVAGFVFCARVHN